MMDEPNPDPKDEPEYDHKLHVTAAALRAARIRVPGDVPDSAWTLRSSIRIIIDGAEPTTEEIAEKRVKAALRLKFADPFRWIEVTVPIPKDETKPCPDCEGSGYAPPKGPSLAGTTPADIERIAFGAEPMGDLVKSPCRTCDGTGFVPE